MYPLKQFFFFKNLYFNGTREYFKRLNEKEIDLSSHTVRPLSQF